MACPGGTTNDGNYWGPTMCSNNGWCTWYPWDNKSSEVQHNYDRCKDKNGVVTHHYNHTKNLETCC